MTLYAGLRPWRGGEIWINPEIDQGFALSNFHGVAGFVNNDPSKGSSYPFARIQRAFFQQTIDLGGEVQKVDADLNQFAMTQTENRVVITAGKFAVGDVFDLNKYAQDPRQDFMNLAVVSTGTFDYASDAFGYTYGVATEWYQGPWTLRGGYFDLSQISAGVELDPGFHEFQWVGELERRYDLLGQPGKILFTYYFSRGEMGTYNAAVSLAQLTGEPANVALVLQPRSRTGIGGNLEQQITPDLGIFARAGARQWERPGLRDHRYRSDVHRRALAIWKALGPTRRHIRTCWQRQYDHQSPSGLLQRGRPRYRHRRRHASAPRPGADSGSLLPLQPLITLARHARLSVRQQSGLQSRPWAGINHRHQAAR